MSYAICELSDLVVELLLSLPFAAKVLNAEKSKLEDGIDNDIKRKSRKCIDISNKELPGLGLSLDSIRELLFPLDEENKCWRDGKVSGQIYHGGKAHQDLLNSVFSMYSLSNPLHADTWPSVVKFESEIVAMAASLMNGGGSIQGVCGCSTSGGTESIILAIKAHRDYYCRGLFGITSPELVCCVSAHAAVDKACDLMGIRLIKVPVDPLTYRADVKAMKRAITPHTIMLYASAPSFPQGAIDPIGAIGQLASAYGIGLHVDACLGGFILPFARKLGYTVPDFDFTVPGVTSMSMDTHKYGYALKGTSVVLYRDPKLRQAQYFCYPHWTGGLYTTTTLMGVDGYTKCAGDVLRSTRLIAEGVRSIPGIKVLGAAEAMIVCFAMDTEYLQARGATSSLGATSDSGRGRNRSKGAKEDKKCALAVYVVADVMTRLGWALNSLQHPASVHICVTLCHVGHEEAFVTDLRLAVVEAMNALDTGVVKGSAAVYGMTAALPGGPVKELLKTYNDVILKI